MGPTVWRRLWVCAVLLSAAVLGGCAHPLTINPGMAALQGGDVQKLDKKVGLLIAEDDRRREVTTPGGGGDKVTYLPYRDMETGLYVALSQRFAGVTRIASPTDPKVQAEQLSYIVTPLLQTTSSSDSALTWPPTVFTIELVCKVTDPLGKPVTDIRVQGEGRATYDEFKGQTSLSANRAAEDVLKKLVKALAEAVALR